MRTFDDAPVQASGEITAAYNAGYADARTLLRLDRRDTAGAERAEHVRARYLRLVEAPEPTQTGCAYLAGFRDAAADNLPCPRAIEVPAAA